MLYRPSSQSGLYFGIRVRLSQTTREPPQAGERGGVKTAVLLNRELCISEGCISEGFTIAHFSSIVKSERPPALLRWLLPVVATSLILYYYYYVATLLLRRRSATLLLLPALLLLGARLRHWGCAHCSSAGGWGALRWYRSSLVVVRLGGLTPRGRCLQGMGV